MKRKQLKEGDIFWEKYNGKYFFGRIILDGRRMEKIQVNPPPTQKLDPFWFSGYLYYELYEEINDIPEFTNSPRILYGYMNRRWYKNKYFEGEWGLVGNTPINPEKVEFPEYMSYNSMSKKVSFITGELCIQLGETYNEEFCKLNPIFSSYASNSLLNIISSLIFQERQDLILDRDHGMKQDLRKWDLRHHPDLRQEIYDHLILDINLSYYELAKQHGFDLKRLF